jgi:AcrR family transcriptional regulator
VGQTADISRSGAKRADATVADRLLHAAEILYGRHGHDGVSLRQISAAAGTGNNYAVQYHFGDVDGLIEAILARRLPEMELRRAQLLAETKAEGRLDDPRALTALLYRPPLELLDENGERTFARFMLSLLSSPNGRYLNHSFTLMPIAEHVVDMLAASQPQVPMILLQERQRLLAILVLTSVFNRQAPLDKPELDGALIDNVLEMATAALTAPATGLELTDLG